MGMKLCRFQNTQPPARVGLLLDEHTVHDLTAIGIDPLPPLLETENLISELTQLARRNLPRFSLDDVRLLTPVERQEVWAAGVTYLRSKKARMDESDFSATAYDRVYEAKRPEFFVKSLPDKVSGPDEPVGIRRDARWSVPEPELALVLNSKGELAGFTVGNDMSSRDIEGENLLYLPQAKIYERSCALGPWIVVGASEAQARKWAISIAVRRQGREVFRGSTSVSQIKRSFTELSSFLFRSQRFPHGAVLLTGTGVVPPATF